MYKLISILFMIFGLFASQVQAQHKHSESKPAQSPVETGMQADNSFQAQLSQVFLAGQQIKDALLASDSEKAQQAAGAAKKSLSRIDVSLLPGKAHTDWKNAEKQLKSSLEKMEIESKLKAQREAFASFSQALYQSIKAFGIAGEQAYYQYCPMALDGAGAYWLSDSKQIKNPYLGDNMLTCGTTKEIIK